HLRYRLSFPTRRSSDLAFGELAKAVQQQASRISDADDGDGRGAPSITRQYPLAPPRARSRHLRRERLAEPVEGDGQHHDRDAGRSVEHTSELQSRENLV